jgi:GH24 family phage-related lysozyme (muramidase)
MEALNLSSAILAELLVDQQGSDNSFVRQAWGGLTIGQGSIEFHVGIILTSLESQSGCAAERRFLAAIMQVSDYVRYGTGLVMTDADGRAVLHFVETSE